ncbi:hypothetical protein BCV70DRAFT_66313 [Testicularia cyperi]|uniref:Uncharacterized protein n=1 Tax=Testicularia cyperi TaxID=1882483 RepID=A0A317XIS9_9BASI|nr:hypothetical protein BCV70DRAFT_66313 [Testicularia cyperi]
MHSQLATLYTCIVHYTCYHVLKLRRLIRPWSSITVQASEPTPTALVKPEECRKWARQRPKRKGGSSANRRTARAREGGRGKRALGVQLLASRFQKRGLVLQAGLETLSGKPYSIYYCINASVASDAGLSVLPTTPKQQSDRAHCTTQDGTVFTSKLCSLGLSGKRPCWGGVVSWLAVVYSVLCPQKRTRQRLLYILNANVQRARPRVACLSRSQPKRRNTRGAQCQARPEFRVLRYTAPSPSGALTVLEYSTVGADAVTVVSGIESGVETLS